MHLIRIAQKIWSHIRTLPPEAVAKSVSYEN